MYIFNPEHDLSLANFSSNYTPPASAVKMAYDLAILPVWYSKQSMVVAEGEINRAFLEDIRDKLPLKAELISYSDVAKQLNSSQSDKIIPWGWNPLLYRKLISHGVPECHLPDMAKLQLLRDQSSRKHAVSLLKELKCENKDYCGESYYFKELDELLFYLNSAKGDKVLKMPLSGSGRGLIWILGEIIDKQTDWCRRVIKGQGGVVAEPVLDKVVDFAMEFCLVNGDADFIGYSLFSSASSGAYKGNVLISDEKIESVLAQYVDPELLSQLRESLKVRLAGLFPDYNGYAGVDMMICNTLSGFKIQPCVEINMRMNMGVVSRLFHNQFMNEDGEGEYIVDYFKKPESACKFHERLQQESPLKIKNGKIVSGYLSLTPVTADTHYVAYVIVK